MSNTSTAPAPVSTTRPSRIIAPHVDMLRKSGISEEEALARGIFSCMGPNDLDKTTLVHHGGGDLTGLVFPLTEADGTTSYQMRLDDRHVTEARGKYLQESGRGAILTVPKKRQRLVGTAKKVLIVEGTKQAIAADIHAPEEWLIIGIQGCHNFSKAGVPLPEIGKLVTEGAEVVIAFDADWKTNIAVWTAASDLQSHLHVNLGTEKPCIASIGGGSKLGLDDVLGSNPVPENRTAQLVRIWDGASTSLGRKPAKKKAPRKSIGASLAGAVMDWAAGQITERMLPDGDGSFTPGEVLADFAVRTTATWSGRDDLNPHRETGGSTFDPYHSMIIATGSGDDRIEVELPRVPENRRHDIPWLLSQAGAEFTTLYYNGRPGQLADIRSAIRSSITDDKLNAHEYRRTGWVDDEVHGVAYLHNGEAIGQHGPIPGLRSKLSDGVFAQITYPDPLVDTSNGEQSLVNPITMKAIDDALGALDHFADPTAFYALEGGYFWTVMGGRQRGIVTAIGKPGSGKSTVAALVRSRSGAAFAHQQMIPAGSTARALADAGTGVHQGHLVIDDMWKIGDGEHARAGHSAAASQIARRAYDGAGSGRARLASNGEGGFETQRPDGSEPGFALVGESIPAPDTEDLPTSALERMLLVRIDRETTLSDTDGTSARALTKLATSGAMNRSSSAFLWWCAQYIAALGGLDEWRSMLDEMRIEVSEQIARRQSSAIPTTRAREVLATVLTGYEMWLRFATECGRLNKDEATVIFSDAADRLCAAQAAHVAELSQAESLFDRLRSAVASGRAVIDGESSSVEKIIVGREYTPRGTDKKMVAFLPDEVARVLGVSISAARKGLKEVAVPDPKGNATWTIAFGSKSSARLYAVPMEIWNPGAEDEEPAPAVDF